MQFKTLALSAIALFSSVALGSVAQDVSARSPAKFTGKNGYCPRYSCLTDDQANLIASTYSGLLTKFDAGVANNSLADNFFDQSDSINFLAGYPLGTYSFPSKAIFIGTSAGGIPIESIETLNVWHTCDIITWRWKATLGPWAPSPVQGINAFQIAPENFKIMAVYSEFNSGTWKKDINSTSC